MAIAALTAVYRQYLACLNDQRWHALGHFVDDNVRHNGRLLRLDGYRDMLVNDFRQIPDLHFEAQMLVCEPPRLAARLAFDCCPKGEFLGLKVGGRRVSFTENVFYMFEAGKIASVWSVIDKAAIEAQL